MITKAQIFLNGIGLHELDESIVLQSINEEAPGMNRTLTGLGGGIGSWVSSTARQNLDVDVEFCIRNIDDYQKRVEVLDMVRSWAAAGGVVKTNYRSGTALYVDAEELPATGYVREWTNKYHLRFRAHGVPYWVDSRVTSQQHKKVTDTTVVFELGGSAPAPLGFTVENTGTKEINTIALEVGGREIRFTGAHLQPGEYLRLDYDMMTGLQAIAIRNADGSKREALSLRTIESADDLWLQPGANEVHLISGRPALFTLTTRGRWV